MALKYYPSNYGRFVITLGVKSGHRNRVRNVTVTIKDEDPASKIKQVAEEIETYTHGRIVSIRQSLGRFTNDVSSALRVEPSALLQGVACCSAGQNIKEKAFLIVPWLRDDKTPLQWETFVESIPMALLKPVDTVTNGSADPDQVLDAGTVKFSKISKMNPEPDMAEIGDVDGDQGADGIGGISTGMAA